MLFAIRLPIRGEKYFYVTVRPVIAITVCFIYRIFSELAPTQSGAVPLFFGSLILCVLQCVLYYLTFSGRLKTKWIAFAAYIVFAILVAAEPYSWQTIVECIGDFGNPYEYGFVSISDLAMYLGIVSAILAARKLPAPSEGESYRFRYGDRLDGRVIRGGIPLDKVAPYIMVSRIGASNYISDSIDVSAMERYVHQKRREGLKHFGLTHALLASYLRMCADFPGLMRFLSGQKVYQRMHLRLKMVVKKDTKIGSPETIISVDLTPEMTASELYEKFNEQVQIANASSDLDSSFDKLAGILNFIPGVFLKFVVWLLKTLDYFGLLPPELLDLSPFHGSIFVTSMGSLGIPPIYHHLYDFGNIPVFFAFGAKRTEYVSDADGQIHKKKYMDYKFVTDERTVDGQYYAACLKRMRSIMLHPEQLDSPPEIVKEDIY